MNKVQLSISIILLNLLCITNQQLTFLDSTIFASDPEYLDNPEDYIIVKRQNTITLNQCPAPHLLHSNSCRCKEGFANYPKDSSVFCQYSQSYQLTAFVLETFPFLGIGYFVIGKVGLGVSKLVIIALSFIFTFFYCKSKDECCKKMNGWTCLTLNLTLFIWCLIDGIMFGINCVRDSKGVPLKQW